MHIVQRLGLGALMAGLLAAAPAGRSDIALTRYHDKQFTVRADVAGRERLFLFDTGEGTTMISPALAKVTGCVPWGNVAAFRMLGERLDTPRCDGTTFRIAGRPYRAVSTIVYALDDIAQDGGKLDGAIGLDLFDGETITLQLGAGRLTVEDAAGREDRIRRGREVPIRLARFNEGGIDVNIGVRTPRGMAWMELDSANAGPTIFVAPAIAPLLGLRADTREPQPVRAEIAPGIAYVGQARVFPGMIIDGNIGMQFMRSWDLTLDLRHGRAWIAPASTARP